MSYYERHLPHWQPEGRPLFVTWRLSGSLPASVLQAAPTSSAGKRFAYADRYLDKASTGPLWLKDARIAHGVVERLRYCEMELKLYNLFAFVVMVNHVHVLFEPRVPLAKITRLIKGHTAREANRILRRTGQAFWQDESFDHWVRSESECQRIISYIERNPVAAGLVKQPEEWAWSSASVQG